MTTLWRTILPCLIAALVGLCPATASADLPRATPESVGLSSERLARVDTYLQGLIDARQRAGFVYLVSRQGKVAHFEARGWADIERQRPMTKESIFSIWSMTKPVTVATLLSHWEEGAFDLQDPVADYIPAFGQTRVLTGFHPSGRPQTEALERPIEIWHLLSHSAGLTYGFWGDELAPFYNEARLWEAADLADYANRVAGLPLLFQPGTRMKYAVGIDVATRLIEIVSGGDKLDAAMEQRVLGPLGMDDTGFLVPPEKLERLAQMYARTDGGDDLELAWGEPSEPIERPRLITGGSGLYTTAPDFWRFAQMLLDGGTHDGTRILGRKTVELMTSDAIPGITVDVGSDNFHRGYGFGYGVAVMRDPARNQINGSAGEFYWEGGSNVYFWCDPQEDLVALLLYQYRPGGGDRVFRRFKSLVYASLTE